jgi:thioredoxin 1
MASAKVTHVNENTFFETLKVSETPVLVDFWAEWCGPCRAIAPVLDDLANEYDGRLKIVKVDVDENHAIANKYSITSIPTLIIFRDGAVKEKIVGALPKGQLKNAIERALGA